MPIYPDQGFYVISNQPSRFRRSGDLYLYAIETNEISTEDVVEFTKAESRLPEGIVETGEIGTSPGDLWGCYLRVGLPKRYKGSRFGTYTVTYVTESISINTFVRPKSEFLNTKGVYTVTLYPEAEGSTELALSDDNTIGVAWKPGCQNIRWCKGKRRNINTGPRLTLTSTKDAGIYTIQRQQRGKRGWFVQIEVIVASCPQGEYQASTCTNRDKSVICQNGGVGKDQEDTCTCPPYYAGSSCQARVDTPPELFALTYGSPNNLYCGDLVGGSIKCKGYLYCPGDLFGCKCFPGWFGNSCDKPCPKGKWGVDCSLTCPDDNIQCNRFDGLDE
ncbi:Tyrosine-protein kinase receptor Tie-2 [Holothuria leucospilota]|uniref:Tyrosine-protein kinase receptor Tie-2 n=1 Tax=Holothuria leucospilota TaxID=206669 RepID=A0A9Q1HLG6_HOLLE|nr:Tyrosine-protein kinase receptor Tie-2 [Holothuria leucospilota]